MYQTLEADRLASLRDHLKHTLLSQPAVPSIAENRDTGGQIEIDIDSRG
jgi:hypothetical protein